MMDSLAESILVINVLSCIYLCVDDMHVYILSEVFERFEKKTGSKQSNIERFLTFLVIRPL